MTIVFICGEIVFGIKDILPVPQKNIPRALGADNSILEALTDKMGITSFSSLVLIVLAFFILALDPSLKLYAIVIFAVGAIRLLYK